MFDWNDLRHFLAVARTGSTLAAGKQLRVSQTTASRRVTALEQALGLTLFERRPTGYVLTPAGKALVAQAEEIEAAANRFADAAASQSRDATGTVRLTVDEIYAVALLPPILKELHDLWPGIRIELDPSDAKRDLGAGEADIALRSTKRLADSSLVGRRIGQDWWTIYCSRDYAASHGQPRRRRDLEGHAFIGGGSPLVWHVWREWLERNGFADQVAVHHGTSTGLLAAARAGLGLAVLPSMVADLDPELVRCLPPEADHEFELWLLTHERLRHTPRVRVVLDYLYERLIKTVRERDRRVEAESPVPVARIA
jgi:DNA-binding transcriptional LysR family regulator